MSRHFPVDRSVKLKAPKISLRRLLLYIGVCGLLFAAIKYLGIYAVCLLGIGILSILAHLAAASVGHRMRSFGDRGHDLPEDPLVGHVGSHHQGEPKYAPTTKLYQKRSLGLPIAVLTCLGIIGGAALPWFLQSQGAFSDSTTSELWMGSVAFALLIGLATFLSTSFLWVLLSAWRQASRDPGG